MISPEILEEERHAGKPVMEGDSSRWDSPESVDQITEDDELDEENKEEEERQLLGPHRVICWSSDDGDDDAVGDYESVDRITVDYELENDKALARVKSIRRAWVERPLTEEEKECNLAIYRLYGSEDPEDSLAEMDSRIEFCKEIQRVDKILQEVVDRTLPVPTVPRPDDIVTDVEFFLLDPWKKDEDFMHRDAEERSLDLYYKRLFPNLPSARSLFYPYLWNRLPEVDAEYLRLYPELCSLVKPDEKSFTLFVNSNLKSRLELYAKAVEIAKQRELTKLIDDDIVECLQDVFKEGDTIAEHKLKEEYDMFLLDCEYDPNLHCANFLPKEDTPVFDFQPELQQSKFNVWMEKRRSLNLGKAEHQEALNLLHAKNLREDCGIRIRYVKWKRAWAKEHGLISEEA